MIEQFRAAWPGIELLASRDDIRGGVDWEIAERRDVVIVHLGGRMRGLETELDGRGGRCGPASPGDVWTIPAGWDYASRASGTTIRYGVLYLEPTGDGIAPVAGVRDEALHRALLGLMAAAEEPGDLGAMRAESLAFEAREHILRAYGRGGGLPQPAGPRLGPDGASRLREFVRENISGRIALDELAGIAGMSVHNLLIAFRAAFGTTPAQYVIARRLRLARRLLARTADDITTIALAAGFSSHSHLTSTFTRRFGHSPREYRAALRPR